MGGGFHGSMGGGFRGGGFRGGFGPGFRGGGFRGGFGPRFRGFAPGNRFFFGFGAPYWWGGGWWGWPYYYPYYPYYPDYPYSGAWYSYPPDPGYTYSYPVDPPGQAACPHANGTPLFLIKLTYESTIWIAQDYSYSPGTLNFVTLQGEVKKTPMDSVDRAATLQLNRSCGVDFQLPR
jgi:hypothetical protein